VRLELQVQYCGGNLCNIAAATTVANCSNYVYNNSNIDIFYLIYSYIQLFGFFLIVEDLIITGEIL